MFRGGKQVHRGRERREAFTSQAGNQSLNTAADLQFKFAFWLSIAIHLKETAIRSWECMKN